MFKVEVNNLSWIDGNPDDPEDLCGHGHAVAYIENEKLEYDATVSAAALYLLRSLTEDHRIHEGENMFPCCGFSMFPADDALQNVEILGCPNGIDWSVIHEGEDIKLITEAGNETVCHFAEYEKTVYDFADKVEAF